MNKMFDTCRCELSLCIRQTSFWRNKTMGSSNDNEI